MKCELCVVQRKPYCILVIRTQKKTQAGNLSFSVNRSHRLKLSTAYVICEQHVNLLSSTALELITQKTHSQFYVILKLPKLGNPHFHDSRIAG